MNARTIYRDTQRGKIAGVIAGLADHFGWNVTYARWGWIIASLFWPPVMIAAYVLMAWLLDKRPVGLADSTSSTAFTSANLGLNSPEPSSGLRNRFTTVRDRFAGLEQRLRSIERTVTSREFQMDRELRKASKA